MMKKKKADVNKPDSGADVKLQDAAQETGQNSGESSTINEERREMERRGGDRRQINREGSEDRRMEERRQDGKDVSEAGSVAVDNCEDSLTDLQKEISSLKELLQRRQADFENYKKRVQKQQADQKKFAIKDFALDIIHINDDLHRAIEASSDIPNGESIDEAHKSFVEGVSLISNRIEGALSKYGVEEIESLDKAFDPNFHEAVEIEESADVDFDTVTKVYQKGFCIDEIVLRSTKVRVTRPSKKENAESGPESANEGGEDK